MTLRKYQPEDYAFAEKVFSSSMSVFSGWDKVPDLTHYATYVIENKGIALAESLGGGEYLATSCFLPEARGPIAGKYQKLAINKLFLETDAIAIWASADLNNQNGVNALGFIGKETVNIELNRIAVKLDFIKWLLTDSYLQREVNAWNVDIPHKNALYAVLRCAENGWGMKGFRQYYIYERLAKDAPKIIPMNVDFTRFFVNGKSIGLDGINQ